jgi:hypothetical protein
MEAGIEWHDRRLINTLYMDKSVKIRVDRGETRRIKIGRGVRRVTVVPHSI